MGFTGFNLEDSLQMIHFREESHFGEKSHINKSLSTETHRYTDPPDLWIYLEKLLGTFKRFSLESRHLQFTFKHFFHEQFVGLKHHDSTSWQGLPRECLKGRPGAGAL